MKKKIVIFSFVAFAMTAFFSIDTSVNQNPEVTLSRLIAVASASGESDSNGCDNDLHDQCTIYGAVITDCDPSFWWHTCGD